MNKRLVWNFEINSDPLLNIESLAAAEKETIRWEKRFFWPADSIITLHGLDDSFLDLSNYKAKKRDDRYALLPNCHYNIKHRRAELLYKPLLQTSLQNRSYGKKINLLDYPAEAILPGTTHLQTATLLAQLKTSAQTVSVKKDTLTYKFLTSPPIKLELARLTINNKIYFSACVEGCSQDLVTILAKHLLGEQVSCDYIDFLKQILAS